MPLGGGLMLLFAAIVIIGLLIQLAIQYWYIVLPVVAVSIFLGSWVRRSEQDEKRRDEEKEERRRGEEKAREEREESEADLKERRKSLSALVTHSRATFSAIRDLVPATEQLLNQADYDFSERAFAPFWDRIENATTKLAEYQWGVQTIRSVAVDYDKQSGPYLKRAGATSRNLPQLRLPRRKLPDARPTAGRLVTIVRQAQKDFQFATIYEQRKTNQILVAGFGTLASAIYEIGDALSSSLSELSLSLHTSLDQLLDATWESSRQTQAASEAHTEIVKDQDKQAATEAKKRRKFEREVVEGQERQEKMLDNIQRRRKPGP